MAQIGPLSESTEQNKHNNTHIDDSTLVITKPRPIYIVPAKSLLAIYPVIALQKDFFKAKLNLAEKLIDMSDFHFMEGMDYDAHPLLDVQQMELRLNDDKSFAEKELKGDTVNIWKDRTVSLASTIRYLAGDIAAQANEARQNTLCRQMGFCSLMPRAAAVTLADVTEGKATLDAVNAVFHVMRHNKPPNKDQDKHDSTKSGSSNDKSKSKPKNNKVHGPGNNNNNSNTRCKFEGSKFSAAEKTTDRETEEGRRHTSRRLSLPISGGMEYMTSYDL